MNFKTLTNLYRILCMWLNTSRFLRAENQVFYLFCIVSRFELCQPGRRNHFPPAPHYAPPCVFRKHGLRNNVLQYAFQAVLLHFSSDMKQVEVRKLK